MLIPLPNTSCSTQQCKLATRKHRHRHEDLVQNCTQSPAKTIHEQQPTWCSARNEGMTLYVHLFIAKSPCKAGHTSTCMCIYMYIYIYIYICLYIYNTPMCYLHMCVGTHVCVCCCCKKKKWEVDMCDTNFQRDQCAHPTHISTHRHTGRRARRTRSEG